MHALIRKYKEKSKLFVKDKFTEEGAGWLLLQQVAIAPLSLITTVLLARILSIADYGFYKYILSVYGIVAIFGFVGFYNIASLNIQRGEDDFFYLGFKYRKILRWIPVFITLVISSYYFLKGNNFLGTLFLITIFSHLFVDLYDFYKVGVAGRGYFRLNAKLEIINYFVSFFPPILTAYFTQNLYYVFITYFGCQFLFRLFAFLYVKKNLGFKKENIEILSKEKLKAYKKESVSLSFNGALGSLGVNGNNAIVFNRLGAEASAIYSLAITFADFIYGIIGAPLGKALLVFSRMSRDKIPNIEKIKLVKHLIKKYFWLAFLAMLATMAALPFVYKLLFAKYFFSYKFAVVYSLSILSIAFYPAYQYFFEVRKIKLLNIIQIVTLTLGLATLFFASMYFGLWGAIIVAIIMRFANNLTSTILISIRK